MSYPGNNYESFTERNKKRKTSERHDDIQNESEGRSGKNVKGRKKKNKVKERRRKKARKRKTEGKN
jgi:hypothetical protein